MKRYIVVERAEEWEQPLGIRTGDRFPDRGVLDWLSVSGVKAIASFPTRALARAAINRTHHYAQAYGLRELPKKGCCDIRPVEEVES